MRRVSNSLIGRCSIRARAGGARRDDRRAGALQQVVLEAGEQAEMTTRATSAQTSMPSGVALLDDRDDLAHEQRLGEGRGGADTLSTMTTHEHRPVLERGRAGAGGTCRAGPSSGCGANG